MSEVVVELGVGMEAPSTEPKKYYPSLYIADVDMPALPEGEFVAKVKLRKKTYTKDYEDDTSSCTFDVLELHLPKVESEEYDNRSSIEKSFDEGVAIVLGKEA